MIGEMPSELSAVSLPARGEHPCESGHYDDAPASGERIGFPVILLMVLRRLPFLRSVRYLLALEVRRPAIQLYHE